MKNEEDGGGGGGRKDVPEVQWFLLNKLLHRIVATRLAALKKEHGPILPPLYGREIKTNLTDEERKELDALKDMQVEALLIQQVRAQTKPKPAGKKPTDNELFPERLLDEWISAETPKGEPEAEEEDAEEDAAAEETADVGGWRIKVRYATWPDHTVHRENQLLSIRKANRSFEVWEQRRDALKKAGMVSNLKMTTEEAVQRAGR